MSDFSFKNKKFPLKLVPTFLLAASVSFLMSFFSIIFLQDNKDFLDLKNYDVEDIEYEFQTLLENSSFDEIVISTNEEEEECQFFAQSGSFRTFSAATSQLEELKKIGYSPVIENVTSQNGFNYKVIIGPFANRSQTNNARENLRRLNMDSLEIKSCIKLTDEST
ncbi:MAG: hypothetical protein CM15mP31_1040 [Gammaproteobacteria bacterium]|nr:MAG: hypothetical protein CM15mP31_1040 [Gammaproteobacteria bacterium]